MRLIDADVFEEFIRKNCADSLVDLWCELVRRQPTAYDIDGVVEQLERCYGIVRNTSVDYTEGLKDAYERAIGIVKAGGTCQ